MFVRRSHKIIAIITFIAILLGNSAALLIVSAASATTPEVVRRGNNYVEVRANFNATTSGQIVEVGFGVTTSSSSPRNTGDFHRWVVYRTTTSGLLPSENNMQPRITNLTEDRDYWVWVYGIRSDGRFEVLSSSRRTNDYRGTGRDADARVWMRGGEIFDRSIEVLVETEERGSAIRERGIVVSRESFTREGNAVSARTDRDRNPGRNRDHVTLRVSGLRHNARYYVRAYVEDSRGRTYSEQRSFRTDDRGTGWGNMRWDDWWGWGGPGTNWGSTSNDISTSTIATGDIQSTSATVRGHLTARGRHIIEHGFVFSSSRTTPNMSDSRVVAGTGSTFTGSFSATLTNLAPSTRYYVRAFYRTSAGTFFGGVQQFTTLATGAGAGPTGTVPITVNFRMLNGQSAGVAQTVHANVGSVITAANLTPPQGFMLHQANWQYTVRNATEIGVLVRSAAETPPTGPVTPPPPPPPAPSAAFMPTPSGNQFRPDIAISRGEIAQAIYNLSNRQGSGLGTTFTDVTPFSEHSNAIAFVDGQGFMGGFPDGSFRPYDSITRAEMAAVLTRVYNLTGTAYANFTDIALAPWATNYVGLVANAGMITGFDDGTFRPNDQLTRAQATALFARAERRSLQALGVAQFNDVPTTHWAHRYIMSAAVPRP